MFGRRLVFDWVCLHACMQVGGDEKDTQDELSPSPEGHPSHGKDISQPHEPEGQKEWKAKAVFKEAASPVLASATAVTTSSVTSTKSTPTPVTCANTTPTMTATKSTSRMHSLAPAADASEPQLLPSPVGPRCSARAVRHGPAEHAHGANHANDTTAALVASLPTAARRAHFAPSPHASGSHDQTAHVQPDHAQKSDPPRYQRSQAAYPPEAHRHYASTQHRWWEGGVPAHSPPPFSAQVHKPSLPNYSDLHHTPTHYYANQHRTFPHTLYTPPPRLSPHSHVLWVSAMQAAADFHARFPLKEWSQRRRS
jgi:hypothetical protein